ncbi:alkaline phosphatase [Agaribacterium sp. ZY112]|uniref:alkaline phosphatase D family protein n=1 Tax=Agaribacterium sp. ZY112 TaxID=3233574 RepID=UPI0035249EE6
MSKINRRDLLKYSALSLGSVTVMGGLSACNLDGDNEKTIDMSFTHGVASGDPKSDKVILWTRAKPKDENKNHSLTVNYELATDPDFMNITHNGQSKVSEDSDFTLKVDAINLSPATDYYYRFKSNGMTSITGHTKTLPETNTEVSQVKLALFSCSNYTAGYFNAYSEAVNMLDLDAAIHLGDYIYEYRMGEYATENAENIGRALPKDNDVELLTLEDYRKRYALYRSDLGLSALHAVVPMIVIPDDHEVANDTYIDGAENHSPETEGDFSERKRNALQAYFEWMPIRPASSGDNSTIHRSFQWGSLVNLMMLDTRLSGRSKQLSYTDSSFFNSDGSFNSTSFAAAVADDNRTMLGAEQLQWLQTELSSSSATWQVLGQQVLMGKMNLPLELLLQLGNNDTSELLTELSSIKARMLNNDPSLSDLELARLNAAAPYNLDAWDGYQYEREVIYATTNALNKNLVVIAGDTHNAWANNLKNQDGEAVGVEYAVASVSSPGLEDYLDLDEEAASGLSQGLNLLIDDLHYNNMYDRGFAVMTFTEDKTQTEWIYVDTILSTNYNLKVESSYTMEVEAGENMLQSS